MMTLPMITTGAEKMMASDPHGLTLTLISLMVVFGCLLILYGAYSLSGAIFSGKFRRRKVEPTATDETEAAIAAALHLYMREQVHDKETGIITIKPGKASGWASKTLTLRKKSL